MLMFYMPMEIIQKEQIGSFLLEKIFSSVYKQTLRNGIISIQVIIIQNNI